MREFKNSFRRGNPFLTIFGVVLYRLADKEFIDGQGLILYSGLKISLRIFSLRQKNSFLITYLKSLHPYPIGIKNMLLNTSQVEADLNVLLFSIIETAKTNDVNPYHYI